MKKISFAWVAPAALLAFSSLALLPACDVIDNPQPVKVTQSAGQRDTLALDSAETAQPASLLVQRVLIEDFTGQYCGNCPRAAVMADSMRRTYPGRVIVTEVHVTDYFAAPRPPHFPLDFRVPVVSTEMDQTLDLSNRGLPQGAVNRAPFASANNDPVATYALWPALVVSQLAQTPAVDLRITPLFDPATRVLRLKISNQYVTAQPGRNLRLGIMVVEDSLMGAQKDYRLDRTVYPEQTVEEYEHHSVMRAALAGTFGTPQVAGPTAGQRFTSYLSYQMPEASVWNDRHCSVIAYISDGDTRQILQVAEVKVP